MPTALEDVRVLRTAEALADEVYGLTAQWERYPRDVIGKQLARAVDSVGANIAESYGRYYWGEKVQFLYYARGSLFEAKYWLNRAAARDLMPADKAAAYGQQLDAIARQLNALVSSLKQQRSGAITVSHSVHKHADNY